ncbi:MAG: type II toxin-antitoxin system prevent-host-death family antitoxin [Solirubrobacteraceae bacterium]|nr:type II toxin-antitoxin system prevent-host-death family antitoxin [Solirubrobacteraceae bacterium]
MRTVKVHEAKTQFSKLLADVEQGEQIVVQRGDVPVAMLVPMPVLAERKLGILRGQFTVPDDFKAIPADFEGYV